MDAASPASSAGCGGRVMTVATETFTGTRVLVTIDGFSKLKEASEDGIDGWNIESDRFLAGGHSWYVELRPDGDVDKDEEEGEDWVHVVLCPGLLDDDDDDQVKARYDVALLTRAGEFIASAQSSFSFSSTCCDGFYILEELNPSPLLGESFQLRCDLSVLVGEVAAVRPPDMHRHLGSLLASQVGADVTFDVGGELFTAHKCILAARSPVFMADLFGPAPGNKENVHGNTAANPIRIDGIEPRVFRALLNFIYTESLPEVNDDKDKVAMAQGLLVAADRYGMERLKSICCDVLCNNIDERTAMGLLLLANRHGCHRLKDACVRVVNDLITKLEACVRVMKDLLTKVETP